MSFATVCLFVCWSILLFVFQSVCVTVRCFFSLFVCILFVFLSDCKSVCFHLQEPTNVDDSCIKKSENEKKFYDRERERENVYLNKRKKKRLSVNELTKECENTEITKTRRRGLMDKSDDLFF